MHLSYFGWEDFQAWYLDNNRIKIDYFLLSQSEV